MKIAFESQLFLKQKKTGIAWNADHVIKVLAQDGRYSCLCDYFAMRNSEEQLEQVRCYEKYGVKMDPCKWFHNVLYKLIWPIIPIPYRLFFPEKRDVTIFFNFIVPPGVQGKTIAIVHDMAYQAHPETVNRKTLKWLQLTLKKSCKRADAIVTVSEFSKKEIVKYLGVPAEKITVMPNGVNLDLFHPGYSQTQIDQVKNKYQINGRYFLYLGTLEPRKNLVRLIQAYGKLWETFKADEKNKDSENDFPYLVLAGGKGWMYESIFETVEELKLSDRVIFTGYVEEEEAPVLMKGARAFVFPSLYEGFGMPPLEAMACGTPVLTSNVSSLPEVVGETGILVDPESVDSIAEGMKTLIDDDELCTKLGEEGIRRAAEFTWDKVVEKMKLLLEKM